MLGFGTAGIEHSDEATGSPAPEHAPHDPQPFGVLVGRDADVHSPRHAEPEANTAEPEPEGRPLAGPADDTRALVDALCRVADSFERVADSIDADRRARRATLDDVDSLLRALVGELRSPAAVAPVVLAGTINAVDAPPSVSRGNGAIDLEAVDAAEADRRPFERARPA
jgi:hypothetical protein